MHAVFCCGPKQSSFTRDYSELGVFSDLCVGSGKYRNWIHSISLQKKLCCVFSVGVAGLAALCVRVRCVSSDSGDSSSPPLLRRSPQWSPKHGLHALTAESSAH